MTIHYSYIELQKCIPTAMGSAPRPNSFMRDDGWSISRDGDVVTIRKPGHHAEVPWSLVLSALPAVITENAKGAKR